MKENITVIKSFRIEGKQSGPHLLVSAGVHGDEYEPVLASMDLYENINGKLQKGRVTIVPVVNYAAYEAGSRYGKDGKDLARVCPGSASGSITEQYAHQICALIGEADYYVDMHTGGLALDIYPLAGYLLHKQHDILNQQRWMAALFDVGLIWGTSPEVQGRTLSVARDRNVPAIYLESGGGSTIDASAVTMFTDGCINILRQLSMMPGEVKKTKNKLIVEDPEEGSSVLQTKMPSPASGIFSAAVHTGQLVKKGDHWGTISSPEDNRKIPIEADRDGLVLTVRAHPFVRESDSLGGIIAADKLSNPSWYAS